MNSSVILFVTKKTDYSKCNKWTYYKWTKIVNFNHHEHLRLTYLNDRKLQLWKLRHIFRDVILHQMIIPNLTKRNIRKENRIVSVWRSLIARKINSMSSQLLHSDNTFEQLAPQTVGEHVSIRNVAVKVSFYSFNSGNRGWLLPRPAETHRDTYLTLFLTLTLNPEP